MGKPKKKRNGVKTSHLASHQWKKGESGNPLGSAHPNHDPIGKKLRQLSANEVHEIITLLLEQNYYEILKLSRNKKAPIMRKWIATLVLDALKGKHYDLLEKLLNRSIGPVAQRHEHSGPGGGPIENSQVYMSTEERRKAIDDLRRARDAAGDE